MDSIPVRYFLNYDININSQVKQSLKISNKNAYSVFNYYKSMICFNDMIHRNYRSVIFAYPEKVVVGFSPPKSIDINTFMQKYPSIDENILVTEMKAGIMIQLFYDYRSNSWEIATKGSVGCKYYFRKKGESISPDKKTYYRMFLDALGALPDQELNDVPFLHCLPKTMSYTFILEHPENVIIMHVERPTLYLIAIYLIYHKSNCVAYIPATIYESWPVFQTIHGLIEFPKQYNNITGYDELPLAIVQQNRGVVFTNIQTGEHAVIECAKYVQLMKTRFIIPDVQYHYLCLRRMGKIAEFISHFPYYKKPFYQIRTELNEFIQNVYRSYMNCYVHQNTSEIAERYYTHIVKIHKQIYLPSLTKGRTPTIINRAVVVKYFNDMEPRELFYLLNYDRREFGASRR